MTLSLGSLLYLYFKNSKTKATLLLQMDSLFISNYSKLDELCLLVLDTGEVIQCESTYFLIAMLPLIFYTLIFILGFFSRYAVL